MEKSLSMVNKIKSERGGGIKGEEGGQEGGRKRTSKS